MIVDTDFLDHWKTRLLVNELGGDELAPLYMIRLWAHCQNRRKTRLEPNDNRILKAVCQYGGEAGTLESALLTSGYIAVDGDAWEVVGFRDRNASLFTAWENGAKGGRPRKTRGQPVGNPAVTRGQPKPKPIRREKTRVDEMREGRPSGRPFIFRFGKLRGCHS